VGAVDAEPLRGLAAASVDADDGGPEKDARDGAEGMRRVLPGARIREEVGLAVVDVWWERAEIEEGPEEVREVVDVDAREEQDPAGRGRDRDEIAGRPRERDAVVVRGPLAEGEGAAERAPVEREVLCGSPVRPRSVIRRYLCGIPTDSRYLQLECSGTNFWGLSL